MSICKPIPGTRECLVSLPEDGSFGQPFVLEFVRAHFSNQDLEFFTSDRVLIDNQEGRSDTTFWKRSNRQLTHAAIPLDEEETDRIAQKRRRSSISTYVGVLEEMDQAVGSLKSVQKSLEATTASHQDLCANYESLVEKAASLMSSMSQMVLFVPAVKDFFKCPICWNTLSVVFRACKGCSRRFCTACLAQWCEENATCPHCREPVPSIDEYEVVTCCGGLIDAIKNFDGATDC